MYDLLGERTAHYFSSKIGNTHLSTPETYQLTQFSYLVSLRVNDRNHSSYRTTRKNDAQTATLPQRPRTLRLNLCGCQTMRRPNPLATLRTTKNQALWFGLVAKRWVLFRHAAGSWRVDCGREEVRIGEVGVEARVVGFEVGNRFVVMFVCMWYVELM